jgi:hypothetical protein
MIFQVLTAASMKMAVFWVVAPGWEIQCMAACLKPGDISRWHNATYLPRFCLIKCLKSVKSALRDVRHRLGGITATIWQSSDLPFHPRITIHMIIAFNMRDCGLFHSVPFSLLCVRDEDVWTDAHSYLYNYTKCKLYMLWHFNRPTEVQTLCQDKKDRKKRACFQLKVKEAGFVLFSSLLRWDTEIVHPPEIMEWWPAFIWS